MTYFTVLHYAEISKWTARKKFSEIYRKKCKEDKNWKLSRTTSAITIHCAINFMRKKNERWQFASCLSPCGTWRIYPFSDVIRERSFVLTLPLYFPSYISTYDSHGVIQKYIFVSDCNLAFIVIVLGSTYMTTFL